MLFNLRTLSILLPVRTLKGSNLFGDRRNSRLSRKWKKYWKYPHPKVPLYSYVADNDDKGRTYIETKGRSNRSEITSRTSYFWAERQSIAILRRRVFTKTQNILHTTYILYEQITLTHMKSVRAWVQFISFVFYRNFWPHLIQAKGKIPVRARPQKVNETAKFIIVQWSCKHRSNNPKVLIRSCRS